MYTIYIEFICVYYYMNSYNESTYEGANDSKKRKFAAPSYVDSL